MLFPFNGKNIVTDLREPFNLQKGWLLWAGVGLVGSIIATTLTGVAVSSFSGETPQREVYTLYSIFKILLADADAIIGFYMLNYFLCSIGGSNLGSLIFK